MSGLEILEIFDNCLTSFEVASEVNDESVQGNKTGALIGSGAALAGSLWIGGIGIAAAPLFPVVPIAGILLGAGAESIVKKKASEAFNFVLDIFKNEEDFCQRALEKLQNRNYEGALNDCSKAIECNAEYANIYFLRGCIFLETENYQEAVENYTKTIELESQYLEAYFYRANIYCSIL